MSDAIKNWLPITKRNRVALGFAFAALVMFVVWNCFPSYITHYASSHTTYTFEGLVFMMIWPEMVDLGNYLSVIRSPDINGFIRVAASMALLLNGLLVLMIVPLWKMIHASKFLTIPLAVANFVGGLVVLWILFKENLDTSPAPYEVATLLMIALTMLVLSLALFIFKNELGLRDDLEVKKMMGNGD
jgi:hypothetical protein